MTTVQSPPVPVDTSEQLPAPESWRELRGDDAIQFEPVVIPEREPPEPGWFADMFDAVFGFFAAIFAPIGAALGSFWPILQWILLGLLAVFVLYLIYRLLGPLAIKPKSGGVDDETLEWTPDRAESLALLEEADRLAASGKFDEATHMLLQRSVGQIAAARPDWVEPSSTARELAALPALSERARKAFSVISDRVERSLFALRSLDKTDWEAARAAYAEFALAKIEGSRSGGAAA